MLRLVLRDLLVARRVALLLSVFYVLYLAIAAGEPLAFLVTTMVGATGAALAGLALDARRGSEALWASLPLDRAAIVRARYIASAVYAGAALAASRVVGEIAAPAAGRDTAPLPLAVYATLAVLIALLVAAYLPFHFKLGPGAGLTAFGAVTATLLLVAAAVGQLAAWLLGAPNALLAAATWQLAGRVAAGRAEAAPDLAVAALLTAALAVVVALYLLSMRISEQFYRERDL